jgi:hypothetical protein
MLEGYVSAGFSPELFWGLTPRMYLVHMRGARVRLEREQSERAWLAWHTAYLPRLKKPINLTELSSGKAEPIYKSWEEQLAGWTAYANYKAH